MTPHTDDADRDVRRMAPIYAGVIAVEVAVLLSIWLFQRWFGA